MVVFLSISLEIVFRYIVFLRVVFANAQELNLYLKISLWLFLFGLCRLGLGESVLKGLFVLSNHKDIQARGRSACRLLFLGFQVWFRVSGLSL